MLTARTVRTAVQYRAVLYEQTPPQIKPDLGPEPPSFTTEPALKLRKSGP